MVIAFLPRSKHLLISWLQSPSAVILEPKKIKSVTVFIVSPSICHEVMGWDAMIFVSWMLGFKPAFSLPSFTFIKRLLSSSSLSAIRVVSSAYLKLLIFLLAFLATVHGVMATTCSPRLQSMGSHKGRCRVQPAESTVPELAPVAQLFSLLWAYLLIRDAEAPTVGPHPPFPSPSQSCVGTKW